MIASVVPTPIKFFRLASEIADFGVNEEGFDTIWVPRIRSWRKMNESHKSLQSIWAVNRFLFNW